MKSGRTVVSENFFRRFKEVFAPYLSMLDVDSRVLERADIEIPVEQYLALWEAAGKVNPNVGLELGMQSEPDDIGALGHAIHCATTVEKALLTLQQFIIVFAQESNISWSSIVERSVLNTVLPIPPSSPNARTRSSPLPPSCGSLT